MKFPFRIPSRNLQNLRSARSTDVDPTKIKTSEPGSPGSHTNCIPLFSDPPPPFSRSRARPRPARNGRRGNGPSLWRALARRRRRRLFVVPELGRRRARWGNRLSSAFLRASAFREALLPPPRHGARRYAPGRLPAGHGDPGPSLEPLPRHSGPGFASGGGPATRKRRPGSWPRRPRRRWAAVGDLPELVSFSRTGCSRLRRGSESRLVPLGLTRRPPNACRSSATPAPSRRATCLFRLQQTARRARSGGPPWTPRSTLTTPPASPTSRRSARRLRGAGTFSLRGIPRVVKLAVEPFNIR